MNKKKLLLSCCKWFIVIAACAVIGINSLFSQICKPKAHETIVIFITGQSCKQDEIVKIVQESVGAQTSASCHPVDSEQYYALLSTSGLLRSDILILPESLLPQKTVENDYAPITEQDMKYLNAGIYGNLTFFTKNDVPYALEIRNYSQNFNLLGDLIDFGKSEENHYLLINKSRPNAAPYSNAKQTSDNAYRALASLLNNALTQQ